MCAFAHVCEAVCVCERVFMCAQERVWWSVCTHPICKYKFVFALVKDTQSIGYFIVWDREEEWKRESGKRDL